MTFDLGWIYLFNIIVNSILSFYTSIFLVLMFVYFLRIKHPRVKNFCYALPFGKIVLDLFLYRFSDWALAMNINPLLAQTGTRTLSIQINPFFGIQLKMQNGCTFSLADTIALSVNPLWIRWIGIIGIVGSFIALVLFTIRTIRDYQNIRRILQSAKPLQRAIPRTVRFDKLRLQRKPPRIDDRKWISMKPIQPHLRSSILGALAQPKFTKPNSARYILRSSLSSLARKKNIRCLTSDAIHSPCIFGKALLFPRHLIDILSQAEFEAIIAHELTHLQWKDHVARTLCALISAAFWWLRARWWHQCMANFQEAAADRAIHQFGISKYDLAEAILKTAKNRHNAPLSPAISLIEHPTHFLNRIQMVLELECDRHSRWRAARYALLALGLSAILFGKMWIF